MKFNIEKSLRYLLYQEYMRQLFHKDNTLEFIGFDEWLEQIEVK